MPLSLLIKPENIKNVPFNFAPSILDKKKLYLMEESLAVEKMLHRNLSKVISVGVKSSGMKEAVSLLRPYNEGRHNDWDNYSTLNGTNLKA
jgi:hypothetical protein